LVVMCDGRSIVVGNHLLLPLSEDVPS
jgi:hypothetical protein